MSDNLTKSKVDRQFSAAIEKHDMKAEIVKLAAAKGEGRPGVMLLSPWADETLGIIVPVDRGERAKLNKVLREISLPNRFSAILHDATQTLEVIWTANKLTGASADVADRTFVFHWEGKKRTCRFGESSDELLTLAKHCIPLLAPTHTEHRNMLSFFFFATGHEHPHVDKPVCMFVDCTGLDEDGILSLVRHLNAHMTYYDREAPQILIHSPHKQDDDLVRPRYVADSFPEEIRPKNIDENVLSYWCEANRTVDPIMRFLLLYRLIEYAAFTFIEARQREDLIHEISRPDLHGNYHSAAENIMAILTVNYISDEVPRMEKMVNSCVRPEIIWKAIEGNEDFFRKESIFEGGFKVDRILSNSCGFENWKVNGLNTTLKALRNIRNCAAHGQDKTSRGTIRPTLRNLSMLQPWVNLIEMFAGEVMLRSSRS